MNVTLNWTVGAGATSQNVQYKLATDGSWTTFSTVGGSVTSETVTGLSDNYIYDFRVVTVCTGGTPAGSSSTQQINFICPSVGLTSTDNSVSYSFLELGGSVTEYTVKLFAADGVTELGSQTPSGTTTRSGTFTGLSASTTYKVLVIATAGSFTSSCSQNTVTTTVEPSCNPPTGVTATLEAGGAP